MILRILFALVLGLAALPAVAQSWQGNWDTTYGQLRLLQQGDRVFGDYAERGRIEARVSPSGSVLRGVFVYQDGRWGLIEFRRDGDRKFEGQWSWGTAPFTRGNRWAGTHDSETPAPLRYADAALGWPERAEGADLDALLAFTGGGAAPGDEGAPDEPERGAWYGSYVLAGLDAFVSLSLDVDHLAGGTTASVHVQAVVRDPAACPPEMYAALCETLGALSGQGSVTLPVDGALVEDETKAGGAALFVAVRLDSGRHVLRIAPDRASGGYFAMVVHPGGGLDWRGPVRREDHICDVAHCMQGRFDTLLTAPAELRGVFSDSDFLTGYPLTRPGDQAGPPQTPTPSGGKSAGQNGAAWMAEDWAIQDAETSEPLGVLRFDRDAGGALTATGELDPGIFDAPAQGTRYTIRDESDTALVIEAEVMAGGQRVRGLMTVGHPATSSSNPAGLLALGGDAFDIVLVPIGSGDWRIGDVPAFGVHLPDYALRGVPPGSDLVLRTAPQTTAPPAGQIPGAAVGLLVLECQPYIDPVAFEDGDRPAREALLDGGWCKILDGQSGQQGWTKGRYLTPQPG